MNRGTTLIFMGCPINTQQSLTQITRLPYFGSGRGSRTIHNSLFYPSSTNMDSLENKALLTVPLIASIYTIKSLLDTAFFVKNPLHIFTNTQFYFAFFAHTFNVLKDEFAFAAHGDDLTSVAHAADIGRWLVIHLHQPSTDVFHSLTAR